MYLHWSGKHCIPVFCIKIQILLLVSQAIPKRKQWNATQTRGPKRVKVEVKSTQTEESQSLVGGMSTEAYDLMVKGKNSFEICGVIYPPKLDFQLKIIFCRNPFWQLLERVGGGATEGLVRCPAGKWEGKFVTKRWLIFQLSLLLSDLAWVQLINAYLNLDPEQMNDSESWVSFRWL